MTEIVTASFHEVEGVKIAFQVVKFAADKWLDFGANHVARGSEPSIGFRDLPRDALQSGSSGRRPEPRKDDPRHHTVPS